MTSVDQTPTRRPVPITQRDGSSLQYSNCRMASIATGLDYDTAGGKTSTGAKMRSYTDDQSGGTDSGDARQSWSRGYSRDLTVRDGSPFDKALGDLRAGRLVHLDVWHATVGGPCLSGSGAYGHTLAVLPDCKDGAWLVADPWCKPASWARVSESRLRAGAEHWGAIVYGSATMEADWVTAGPVDTSGPDPVPLADQGGPDPTSEKARKIVGRVVKRLMSTNYPGKPSPTTPPLPLADTGGARPILYTASAAMPLKGGHDLGIAYRPLRWDDPGVPLYLDSSLTERVTETQPGGQITTIGAVAAKDADGADYSAMAVLVVTGKLRTDGQSIRAILWTPRSKLPENPLTESGAWQDSVWTLADQPAGRYPCPDQGDCEDPDEVRAERDDEWLNWMLDGSPAQQSDPG